MLDEVLQLQEDTGMWLKLRKCVFLALSMQYLGPQISREGLELIEDKLRAIIQAPAPADVSELKACLGWVNYYSKFIPTWP